MADLLLSTLLPTLSITKPNYPFLSFPNRPHRQSLFSFSTSTATTNLTFKTTPTFIPLVSQATGWSALEQEDEEKGTEPVLSEWEDDEESEGEVIAGGNDVAHQEEPSDDAKLFVGNMTFDVDSEGLAKLFDQAGVVEIAEVIYNRDTNQSRGFGFVTMSTVEEAEKAVEVFNGYDLNGRLLTVNKASRRGSQPERIPREFASSFKIYAGNLPWQVDDERLEQVFSEHGKVVDARVVYDRESGRSRGFGFVTMASITDQDAAISALDGQSLEGRAIRVNVAEEKPRRGLF